MDLRQMWRAQFVASIRAIPLIHPSDNSGYPRWYLISCTSLLLCVVFKQASQPMLQRFLQEVRGMGDLWNCSWMLGHPRPHLPWHLLLHALQKKKAIEGIHHDSPVKHSRWLQDRRHLPLIRQAGPREPLFTHISPSK